MQVTSGGACLPFQAFASRPTYERSPKKCEMWEAYPSAAAILATRGRVDGGVEANDVEIQKVAGGAGV